MPRPHKHPSLTCYKHHGCRCDGCRQANTDYSYRQYHRKSLAVIIGTWVPPAERTYNRNNGGPLSEEEVKRLRRVVGLESESSS